MKNTLKIHIGRMGGGYWFAKVPALANDPLKNWGLLGAWMKSKAIAIEQVKHFYPSAVQVSSNRFTVTQ